MIPKNKRPIRRIPLAVLFSIVCALVVAPAGIAATPVAQTLTPSPLPWLTCMPVGGGTICEGTMSIAYVEDSGVAMTLAAAGQAEPGGPDGANLQVHFFDCTGPVGTPSSFDAELQHPGGAWHLTDSTQIFNAMIAFDETTNTELVVTPGFERNNVEAVTCRAVRQFGPLLGHVFLLTGVLTPATGVAAAGLGGPPVAQTLTPSPLPWLTCRPVGGGTICEGTRSISYGPEDSGFACDAGPSAFVILDTATRHVRVKWTYDEQGFLLQRLIHFRYTSARLTNSVTGAELPYTQTQLRIDDLSVPGDLGSAITTYAGEIISGSPGGAPVIVGAGKIVLDPTGEITFVGGTSGLADLYSGEVSALCAALS